MKHLDKAQQQLGFRIHALVFFPALVAMAIVNFIVGPPWWVVWSALGWGIGLLIHGWCVRRYAGTRASSPS